MSYFMHFIFVFAVWNYQVSSSKSEDLSEEVCTRSSSQVLTSVLGCVMRCMELNSSQSAGIECQYDNNLVTTQIDKPRKGKKSGPIKSICINSLCIKQDPAYNDDELFEAFKSEVKDEGVFKACGTQLYFSKSPATFKGAQTACLKRGMRLISFESNAKVNCVSRFAKDDLKMGGDLKDHWSSGAPDACSQGHVWCGLQAPLTNTEIWKTQDSKNSKKCAAFTFFTSWVAYPAGLIESPCDSRLPYICETALPKNEEDPNVFLITTTEDPACVTPYCPPCPKKPIKIKKDQLIPLSKPCGKSYLFRSKNLVSHKEAHASCCALNMTLASVENKAKMSCIINQISSSNLLDMFFLVSGSSIGCKKSYVWCNTGQKFNKEVPWGPKGRDNMYNEERCSMLVTVFVQLGIVDTPCEEKVKFLCESVIP